MPTKETSDNIEQGNMKVQCVARRARKGCAARAFVFTYFYDETKKTEVIKELIKEFELRGFKYMMGLETCPSTGRAHVQGYVKRDTTFEKRILDKIIDGNWCEVAGTKIKGSNRRKEQIIDRSNWKYTTKEGEFFTNMEEPPKDDKEIAREDLAWRVKSNKFFKENLGMIPNTIENIDEIRDAIEICKYYHVVHGYAYLSGSITDARKTLTKAFKKGNKIKGIVMMLNKEDEQFEQELYQGLVNDQNGKTIFWDSLMVEVIIFRDKTSKGKV